MSGSKDKYILLPVFNWAGRIAKIVTKTKFLGPGFNFGIYHYYIILILLYYINIYRYFYVREYYERVRHSKHLYKASLNGLTIYYTFCYRSV